MNKLIITLLLLPNILLSQNQKVTKHSRDGKLYEEYYILSKHDSTLHGEYKRYHKNGALAAKSNFKNGLKEGPFTEFYEDGVE